MKLVTTLLCFSQFLFFLASAPGEEQQWEIKIREYFGHRRDAGLIHQRVRTGKQGLLWAGQTELLADGKKVDMQLDNIAVYPDGSIREADVWFRSDLPAHGARAFLLRASKRRTGILKSELRLEQKGQVLVLSNSRTAVRIPAGTLDALKSDGGRAAAAKALAAHLKIEDSGSDGLPGPLLEIRLPSGNWTAGSRVFGRQEFDFEIPIIQPIPEAEPGAFVGYETEILAQGPIFIRARVTYRFAGDGEYAMDVTLRADEPLVRIDERYRRAGSVVFNLGANLKPTAAHYQSFRVGAGKGLLPVDYENPGLVALFVGWDGFYQKVAPALPLTGDPSGDCLALVSTDSDWLPFPYNQAIHVETVAGGGLRARASLSSGQRHWGIYAGKTENFPTPDLDFYRWWWRNIALPLDKITNWQIDWPGIEELKFPHTFFSADELPEIRKRLQADSVTKEFVEKTRQFKERSLTDAAVPALVYGEPEDMQALEKMFKKDNYIDQVPTAFLNQASFYEDNSFNFMQMSDELLKRYVGIELMLGSGLLSPEEHRQTLREISFAVHLMNDTMFWPPNYPFSPQLPEPYPAYVQGTPNQKICYVTALGMCASILSSHPRHGQWMERVIEEYERVASDSVAPSGAHLESPFYSSRDTMRFGPFWTALTRAGVKGPKVDHWLQRLKNCYLYLSDMLTVPEPRMGGRRVYHPLGRSSSGVIDPTLMIAAEPFGKDDPEFLQRLRWSWEAQGRPSPDILGTTGGRDMGLTLLAFSRISGVKPSESPLLKSVRWEGMGAMFRSQVGSGFESNVVFRHDPFCWNLYEANNGAVYFYGKGAPLLPRFGGYWMGQQGQCNLMSIPFGNRIVFDKNENPEWTDALGNMTEYASMGNLADFASGVTRDGHWRREVLFAKDLGREDPVYLLVRDDVSHPDSASALHWWVMSKQVQPDGLEKPGVIAPKGRNDKSWLANLGKNWKEAPKLAGQLQHFQGQCGVDLDLFIASPADPKIITDAAGVGPGMSYCANMKLYEYQQLVRIEQSAGKGYLTLLAPRWPGSAKPEYRTIAEGTGVAIQSKGISDRLILSPKKLSFEDELVTFEGRSGFARTGSDSSLRLMVNDGRIQSKQFGLSSRHPAALHYDGKSITVVCPDGAGEVEVDLPPELKGLKIKFGR